MFCVDFNCNVFTVTINTIYLRIVKKKLVLRRVEGKVDRDKINTQKKVIKKLFENLVFFSSM